MAEVGTVVDWQGMRFTIEDIKQIDFPSGGNQVTVTFALENFDSPPVGFDVRGVDVDGFPCHLVFTSFDPVQPGEKARKNITGDCDAQLKTLHVDGIRFEFPQP